ncbi:MAG: orotidine-5'-phosphate decarboxylase [Saprospiraceae bacterium]|nr:orotidine-5'-phosphate decarboxylase [Candidatus Opimibacter iunctus]
MKDKSFLRDIITSRKTVLTIGLDADLTRLPAIVNGDLLAFNKAIIDATREACIAYKPNFAFYESLGSKGWEILEQTINYIGDRHFIIGDAKRGDIGNTSAMYATAVFDHMGCDAITVNPYMGEDCVMPFYKAGKWVIILALTSNHGSSDFQQITLNSGKKLFQKVMQTASTWGTPDNTMFVLGATHPSEIQECRDEFPDHFFLIPGVGAQGGDLDAICAAGLNSDGGLFINASRSILYASPQSDFAEKAYAEASTLNSIIRPHLEGRIRKS